MTVVYVFDVDPLDQWKTATYRGTEGPGRFIIHLLETCPMVTAEW